jgi:hypothetical protein
MKKITVLQWPALGREKENIPAINSMHSNLFME